MSFKSLEAFEAEAELFYKDTGYLAPGKSEPAAWGSRAYDREAMRRKVKDAWDAGRRRGLPDAEREAEKVVIEAAEVPCGCQDKGRLISHFDDCHIAVALARLAERRGAR